MSIVADQPLRAGLAEEIERQEREDNAEGPEPEGRYVLSRAGRWERELVALPALPPGYIAAASSRTRTGQGSDEVRVRHLMIAAVSRWGWGR
ncbi:hypothetical protein ACFU9B_41480 [Streptomyces sp. NPDC057592]|uniref:hypothetical protein n=1 Tax=unclassified Streptomyces TaxID=2593676 RepID=UPI0036AB4549